MSHESDFWIGVMADSRQQEDICRKAASKLRIPVSILSGDLKSIRERYNINEGQSHVMIYTESKKTQIKFLERVLELAREAEKN